MEVVVLCWLILAVIVGVGANTRGREGGGWFLLAVIISPLLAGLLLLALPRKPKPPPGYGVYFSEILPGGGKRREARRAREQIEQDQHKGVFRPDGMVAETPYRLLPNGEIEALIQGSIVRFQSVDHLRSMKNTERV